MLKDTGINRPAFHLRNLLSGMFQESTHGKVSLKEPSPMLTDVEVKVDITLKKLARINIFRARSSSCQDLYRALNATISQFKGNCQHVKAGSLLEAQRHEDKHIKLTEKSYLYKVWDEVISSGHKEMAIEGVRIRLPEIIDVELISGNAFPVGVLETGEKIPFKPFYNYEYDDRDSDYFFFWLVGALTSIENGIIHIHELSRLASTEPSKLKAVWKYLIEVSKKLNNQIFVTVFDAGCMRILGEICEKYPEEQNDIRIYPFPLTVSPFPRKDCGYSGKVATECYEYLEDEDI